jgi:hypothetical protein
MAGLTKTFLDGFMEVRLPGLPPGAMYLAPARRKGEPIADWFKRWVRADIGFDYYAPNGGGQPSQGPLPLELEELLPTGPKMVEGAPRHATLCASEKSVATEGADMGNWNITVRGIGSHHNPQLPADANRMAAEFVRALKKAGHSIVAASFTHGAEDDLQDPDGYLDNLAK